MKRNNSLGSSLTQKKAQTLMGCKKKIKNVHRLVETTERDGEGLIFHIVKIHSHMANKKRD